MWILIVGLLLCTNVYAAKTYLYEDSFYTKNDNYNYGDYILDQNQILIVPPEKGILSNDNIVSTNYIIKIFENSINSNIDDIEINETTGSFTYIPNDKVVGEVSFKYYIEYDDGKSNISYIYFYVKNTKTNYIINYYDYDNKKIIPSITKISTVNKVITENAINIDGYRSLTKPITKKMNVNNNNFDFYYEKVPNTGI